MDTDGQPGAERGGLRCLGLLLTLLILLTVLACGGLFLYALGHHTM